MILSRYSALCHTQRHCEHLSVGVYKREHRCLNACRLKSWPSVQSTHWPATELLLPQHQTEISLGVLVGRRRPQHFRLENASPRGKDPLVSLSPPLPRIAVSHSVNVRKTLSQTMGCDLMCDGRAHQRGKIVQAQCEVGGRGGAPG